MVLASCFIEQDLMNSRRHKSQPMMAMPLLALVATAVCIFASISMAVVTSQYNGAGGEWHQPNF